MIDCKLRTSMIAGALIVGGLIATTGCGTSKSASPDASHTQPTITTSSADQAKLQATIQKAQAQGAAQQALMAAHPHVPVRPTGN